MIDVTATSAGNRKVLPVLRQAEAAECGSTCLLMVVHYHGNPISMTEFREVAPTPVTGLTLLALMQDATRLGMISRPLRLELEELADLQTPCILHWDLNHFVVLKSAGKASVEIHDPARGHLKLAMKDVGKHFTGIALEIRPSREFQRSKGHKRRISLASLFGRSEGLPKALLQVVCLALVLESFVILTPMYLQWVLDQVIVSADFGLLNVIALGFLLVCVFRVIVTALRSWLITWIGANLNVQWESNIFRHLLALRPSFFEKRHVGDILSRFTSVKSIQNSLSTQFVSTMLDGAMSILVLALMLSYSRMLTGIVLAAFVCYMALRHFFFGPLRDGNQSKIEAAAEQQSCLIESVRGARILQLSNQQAPRIGEYTNRLTKAVSKDVRIQRLQIAFEAGNGLIFGLCRVALVWLAARLVVAGDLSAGMLISFMAYADLFSQRSANFINQVFDLKMLGMHAERVSEIALTRPEGRLYPSVSQRPADSSLEVQGLSFRYGAHEPWVFRDVSFRIEPGECVAIVGPSGTGKSTLAKLILGLLDPEGGKVLYGGLDVDLIGRVPFRHDVASVMQDDTLFAGSIASNIAFFDPEFDLKRVMAAAQLAQIHEEVSVMPMGYRTLIGDMGSALSGGQRQRILLARALYRHPTILILDEATSHLDVECEKKVSETISRLAITRLIIAHRQETIASASRIIDITAFRRESESAVRVSV